MRCIDSWRSHLPNYQIYEWNESTFDVQRHPFTAEMHARRRWAFLSDYVRMWAIHREGGVYFDTDCEVHRPLDPLLNDRAFVGFERFFDSLHPFTACFGAEAGHRLMRLSLDYYDSPGARLGVTNTLTVSEIMRQVYHVRMRDRRQLLADGLVIYPSYVLCTPNLWHRAFVTHHFDGSWTSRSRLSKPIHLRIAEQGFRILPSWAHPTAAKLVGVARRVIVGCQSDKSK